MEFDCKRSNSDFDNSKLESTIASANEWHSCWPKIVGIQAIAGAKLSLEHLLACWRQPIQANLAIQLKIEIFRSLPPAA